ncbi:SDR family NAD(P)-dependent oxidoreductase [Candidatus Bipolaricaulota bacterium]
MMIQYDYTGKTVIVTGAARGVGRAMAQGFAAMGANVIAADRDAQGLGETAQGSDQSLVTVVGDISSPDGAKSIVQAALDTFGGLDICVNNAAVAPHASLLEERVEVWDTVYAVNCRGTFLMTQAAAKAMIELNRGGGRIINFSSGVSKRGSAGAAAYASSRAATESFSRVAAIELAPYDILVNTVSPGLIDTQPKPLPPVMAENLKRRIPTLPLARPGLPEEVANVVYFLASEASGYVCGALYTVDGAAGIGVRPTAKITDDDPRYDWVTGKGS